MREAEYFARYILISGRELHGSTLGMLKLGVTWNNLRNRAEKCHATIELRDPLSVYMYIKIHL